MTTAFDSIFAREVAASRKQDLLTATELHLMSRQADPIVQFFISRLRCDDHDAVHMCTTVLGDQIPHTLLPDWECSACGCSDSKDIYGERVCGCDSCSIHGCESPESRSARKCKRSREIHEAGIAFAVIADALDTLITEYEIPDMVLFLQNKQAPAFLEEMKDECIRLLLTAYPQARDTARRAQLFLLGGISLNSEAPAENLTNRPPVCSP